MQLEIRSSHLEIPADTRRSMERRLRLALGRNASRVDRASITVEPCDEGSSTQCRIRARLRGGSSVLIEESALDLEEAAAGAMWRLEHFLDRQRLGDRARRSDA